MTMEINRHQKSTELFISEICLWICLFDIFKVNYIHTVERCTLLITHARIGR